MIPLLLVYLLVNYQILTSKHQNNKILIVINIFILLIMVTTKYSSLFIIVSILPFCLYLFVNKK